MKILSLNTWHGGRLVDAITPFLRELMPQMDVICFQEAYEPLLEIIAPYNDAYFSVSNEKYVGEDPLRQLLLVKKGYEILRSGSAMETNPDTGLDIWVTIRTPKCEYFITNYHGHPQPGSKLDTKGRLQASQTLLATIREHDLPTILMGDFNLLPETESVRMIEREGFRNLISEYQIPTTRNHYIWDDFPDDPQYFADYTFVTPDIQVASFTVPPDIVSDHQAMILEVV